MGFRVIVVSNQPGAALGLFPEEALKSVHAHLVDVLPALDGFYYCPHRPDAGCACRKPEPGLLERAAREQDIDLSASWMIGDILDDIEAGRRAGCRTILARCRQRDRMAAGRRAQPAPRGGGTRAGGRDHCRRAMSWTEVRNLLCVRLDSIGDVLMTTPAIRACRESFGCRVTLLTSRAGAAAARHVPEVDEFWCSRRPG